MAQNQFFFSLSTSNETIRRFFEVDHGSTIVLDLVILQEYDDMAVLHIYSEDGCAIFLGKNH